MDGDARGFDGGGGGGRPSRPASAAATPTTPATPPRGAGRRDLTSGPIGRGLIAFALPTLASSVLQSLNGSINTIWIGRFLGEQALAATSNANIVMFLTSAFMFGFGMAATILIGQSVGRRDLDGARRAVGAAMGLFLLIAAGSAVAGWISAPAILRALAVPPAAATLALTYLRVMFLAVPGGFVLTLLMMALRGAGDSLTPLGFMALSVVLDSGLNPLLIRGFGPVPALGIAGSATATVTANTLAAAALLLFIYARDLPLRLRGRELRYLLPEPALLRTLVVKGLPMGVQMIVVSTAALAMIGLVDRQGLTTTAAFGVTAQLWTYIQLPAMAIGAAVSAMTAQNIGAGRWDRVPRILRSGLLFNLLLTGGLVALVTVFDGPALSLFLRPSSPATPVAAHINLVVGWSFVLFGMTMVLFAVVRANGAVIAPLLTLAVAMFPVRLSVALGLRPWLGVEALWWSLPAGSAFSLLAAAAYYRWGGWRSAHLPAPADAQDAPAFASPDDSAVHAAV